MNSFYVRAAFFAALAFSTIALAQKVSPSRESAKDIIEKAQNLIIQRDRQQALTILSGAIRREKGRPSEAELRTAVDGVATVFLGDRAQQAYEASVSLRRSDINQSQQRIQEALVMEPDNLLLVLEQARIYILKGDCRQAEAGVLGWQKRFTTHPSLTLAMAQVEICRKSLEGVTPKIALINSKLSSENSLFWLVVAIEKAMLAKDRTKAQEILAMLTKLHPAYPDRLFWQHRLETKSNQAQLYAEKYLMTCKNISAATYRQYMIDPMICRRISDEDADQKGPNVSGQ